MQTAVKSSEILVIISKALGAFIRQHTVVRNYCRIGLKILMNVVSYKNSSIQGWLRLLQRDLNGELSAESQQIPETNSPAYTVLVEWNPGYIRGQERRGLYPGMEKQARSEDQRNPIWAEDENSLVLQRPTSYFGMTRRWQKERRRWQWMVTIERFGVGVGV